MATERRRKQQLLLALLVVVLLGAIYRLLPATSATPAPSSNDRQSATRAPRSEAEKTGKDAPRQPATPGVHLDALSAERPRPEAADRNLFRFKPPPAPPAPPPVRITEAPPPPVPTGPPPPPPLPPIPLKFIGIMGSEKDKIAVLSDGRGAPINGKEGDLVLGQYRILKIGVESVDLAYADGRGRQTIRISGQ
jgi:hypothetical protein